jgi:hypothetical protein
MVMGEIPMARYPEPTVWCCNSLPGRRHSSIRSWLCGFVSALILSTFLLRSAAAQTIRDVPGFWGLRQGNEFTVLMASSRQTDISVDGEPDVARETSESLLIQYRIVAIERSGDVSIKAIVRKADRRPPSAIMPRLAGATFALTVHPDGNVSTDSLEGRDTLLTYLSGSDPESEQVLRKCLTEDTIASWFSIPFWLIRPVDDGRNLDEWQRKHDVSLGTLGSLRMDLSFRLGDIRDNMADVAITSDAHFRPLVLPDADAAAFPFLSNTTVEIDEVSGTGRFFVASRDADDPPGPRPEFESVSWMLRLHGETELPSARLQKTVEVPDSPGAAGSAQDVAKKSVKVTFREIQNHVWTLQSFSIGIPRIFEYDRLDVPVQKLEPAPPQ